MSYLCSYSFYPYVVSFSDIGLILSNRAYNIKIVLLQNLVILILNFIKIKQNQTQALKSFVTGKKSFRKTSKGRIQTHITCNFWFSSHLHYQPSQTLLSLMAVLAYTSAFCVLMWMSYGMCRLLKINFVILKDTAFIWSKSCFNPC